MFIRWSAARTRGGRRGKERGAEQRLAAGGGSPPTQRTTARLPPKPLEQAAHVLGGPRQASLKLHAGFADTNAHSSRSRNSSRVGCERLLCSGSNCRWRNQSSGFNWPSLSFESPESPSICLRILSPRWHSDD